MLIQTTENFLGIYTFPFMKYVPKYNMCMIFFGETKFKEKEGSWGGSIRKSRQSLEKPSVIGTQAAYGERNEK